MSSHDFNMKVRSFVGEMDEGSIYSIYFLCCAVVPFGLWPSFKS